MPGLLDKQNLIRILHIAISLTFASHKFSENIYQNKKIRPDRRYLYELHTTPQRQRFHFDTNKEFLSSLFLSVRTLHGSWHGSLHYSSDYEYEKIDPVLSINLFLEFAHAG